MAASQSLWIRRSNAGFVEGLILVFAIAFGTRGMPFALAFLWLRWPPRVAALAAVSACVLLCFRQPDRPHRDAG